MGTYSANGHDRRGRSAPADSDREARGDTHDLKAAGGFICIGLSRAWLEDIRLQATLAVRHRRGQSLGLASSTPWFGLVAITDDATQAEFAAQICTELVGAANVDRQPPFIVASEDFSFMLEQVSGCYINIWNGVAEGGCEVYNPEYDFNDVALTLGAAFFTRVVESTLRDC